MKIAADYLLSLINDVLQMSKIEEGHIVLTHEYICLKDLSMRLRVLSLTRQQMRIFSGFMRKIRRISLILMSMEAHCIFARFSEHLWKL